MNQEMSFRYSSVEQLIIKGLMGCGQPKISFKYL